MTYQTCSREICPRISVGTETDKETYRVTAVQPDEGETCSTSSKPLDSGSYKNSYGSWVHISISTLTKASRSISNCCYAKILITFSTALIHCQSPEMYNYGLQFQVDRVIWESWIHWQIGLNNTGHRSKKRERRFKQVSLFQ